MMSEEASQVHYLVYTNYGHVGIMIYVCVYSYAIVGFCLKLAIVIYSYRH